MTAMDPTAYPTTMTLRVRNNEIDTIYDLSLITKLGKCSLLMTVGAIMLTRGAIAPPVNMLK